MYHGKSYIVGLNHLESISIKWWASMQFLFSSLTVLHRIDSLAQNQCRTVKISTTINGSKTSKGDTSKIQQIKQNSTSTCFPSTTGQNWMSVQSSSHSDNFLGKQFKSWRTSMPEGIKECLFHWKEHVLLITNIALAIPYSLRLPTALLIKVMQGTPNLS